MGLVIVIITPRTVVLVGIKGSLGSRGGWGVAGSQIIRATSVTVDSCKGINLSPFNWVSFWGYVEGIYEWRRNGERQDNWNVWSSLYLCIQHVIRIFIVIRNNSSCSCAFPCCYPLLWRQRSRKIILLAWGISSFVCAVCVCCLLMWCARDGDNNVKKYNNNRRRRCRMILIQERGHGKRRRK